MKQNVNRGLRTYVAFRKYPDKNEPILCAVDNYPGSNPAYKKHNGFRCNDISLLDRLSYNQNFDDDLAKVVASRVKEVQTLPASSLTPEQMLSTLRPSWVQTAAEVRDWEETIYQYMSTTDITPDDVQKSNEPVVQNDVVETVDSNPA